MVTLGPVPLLPGPGSITGKEEEQDRRHSSCLHQQDRIRPAATATNVRAARGCSIRLNGVEYQVNRPELADWAQAGPSVRAAYSPAMRAMSRLLDIRQFMLLRLPGRRH